MDEDMTNLTTMTVYPRSLKRLDKLSPEFSSDGHRVSRQDAVEHILDIIENKMPIKTDLDILLEDDLDRKILYNILKMHPEASKFIYKKYTNHKDILKEICDPENPLYLPNVSDKLSGYFQYEDITKEHSRLKADIQRFREDISGYREERTTLEKETAEISKGLDTKKKELDDIQKQLINIHETTGLDRIMNFIHSVQGTTKMVLSRGQGEVYSGDNSLMLNIDKVMKIEEISRSASELETYLKTEDFLSGNKLDEEKQKLLDEMKSVRTGLDAWMSKNPVRQLDRIDNKLDELCKYADQSKNRIFERGHGMIIGKANEVGEIISEIRTQIAMEQQVKK